MQLLRALDKPAPAASNAGLVVLKLPPYAPALLTAWILFCAFCNCVGWLLSAFHQLNATGYTVAFGLGVVVVLVFRKKVFPAAGASSQIRKLMRRFRRPFPFAFLVLAMLAFAGGALYAPNNYDALAYRTPRVLHWLAEGRWHWIHTEFQRLNTRAPAFEWLSAPWIALLRTDRFLFLINIISFLLLPGLVFSVFHRLGVCGRVAWHWMWLVPTGYCFVLQAGSIGNDLFAAPLVLAALAFGLRAQKGKRHMDLWLSILAAALFTGVKANTLPLLLAWGSYGLFCGALVLLVAAHVYRIVRNGVEVARQQMTVLLATPKRLLIETNGPFGASSHDLPSHAIHRVRVCFNGWYDQRRRRYSLSHLRLE